MLTIKREPPSQRRFFRLTSPAVAVVKDVPYPTKDWSLGGFRIDDFKGEAVVGERVPAQFGLNFHGFSLGFQVEVEVVRLEANGTLAARFIELGDRERELMLHFASSLTSGEMSPVGDTLARMDIPVTPVSTSPKAHEAAPLPPARLKIKRVVYSVFYILSGTALGLYLLLMLYWHTFRLDVDHAVITVPLHPVISQDLGRVREVMVHEGDAVTTGQPLLRIEDDVLTQELNTARLNLDRARAELRTAGLRLRNEEQKLKVYKDISRNKLAAARELVASLSARKTAAEGQLRRLRALQSGGAVSEQMVEQAESRLAEVQGALAQARAEQRIAESAQVAVRNGAFYDERTLVGDLQSQAVSQEDARERVKLAEAQLKLAEERVDRLTYRAPTNGKVLRMGKVVGMTVNRGETVAIVEPKVAMPVIDAFLTQDEVAVITLGHQATVWIPALDRQFTASVTRIDRTAGFVPEVRAGLGDDVRYAGRGTSERTATVQLAFDELTPEMVRELRGGLPALVSMPKHPAFLRAVKIFLGLAIEDPVTTTKAGTKP
ncbi:MAG: HlyD family efflux transporter periplasmic adaptor subunit [Myxococcota bacterium]